MYLLIRSPVEVVWEGEVSAVEAENADGPFTIWPDHANFMTPLRDTDIIATFPDGGDCAFALEDAVLFLEDNTVKVYVHDAKEAESVPDEEDVA